MQLRPASLGRPETVCCQSSLQHALQVTAQLRQAELRTWGRHAARRWGLARQSRQKLTCEAAASALSTFHSIRVLLPTGLPALVLPTFLVSLGACWFDRPRGWADRTLVEVRQSSVHDRGIFAKVDLSPGSTLGTYPGRPRSSQDMASKAQAVPASKSYAFRTTNGYYIDPTDMHGCPCSQPRPGLPWIPIDPLLAFVNEPPPGRLTNVHVVDGNDDLELVFVVTAAVRADEELFVDYGTTFDRSDYS